MATIKFFCQNLHLVNGTVPPLAVLRKFAAETSLTGIGQALPLGVHGLYLLDDKRLKRECPEIELIRRGARLKNYNQDFGHAGTRLL